MSKKSKRKYNWKVTERWPDTGTETLAEFALLYDANLFVRALDKQDIASPSYARPTRKVKEIK